MSPPRKRGSNLWLWIPAYAGMTLWIITSIVFAQNASEDIFFEANKLYSAGEYAKAAERYEAILKSGVESGNLYYNLANTYFKLDRKGKALAAYERAKRLIPADEDLFANMNFITSLLEEAQPEEKLPWQVRVFNGIRSILPAGGWFILTVLLYFATAALLAMSILRRSFRKMGMRIAAVAAVMLFVSFLFFKSSVSAIHHSRYGIVIVPEVEVRYSPSYSGAVAFKLHEGTRAQLVRQQDEWMQIRLTQDKNGWVEANAIEEI